jgi:SAM-dependent methyltransferase
MHLPDLTEALAEFARVLRPGGHLVLSDWRALSWNRREPFVRIADGGVYGYADSWSRPTSEYLRSALALGFELRGIEELPGPRPLVDDEGTPKGDPSSPPAHRPGEPPNRWALHRFAPEATNAAYRNKPLVLILHLQLGCEGDSHDSERSRRESRPDRR